MSEPEKKSSSWSGLPFTSVFEKIWRFFGGRILLGLVAAVGALIFFLWLADEVFEGATKAFDANVRNAVHSIATPWLTQAMIFLSFVGSFPVLTGLAILIIVVFWRLKWKRAVALFLITVIGEVILSLSLKGFFQRARPEPFFNYPVPLDYSFPSGHAMGSFCYFGILAWLITARLKNRLLKALIWTFTGLLVLFIGLSRIYLGVHFPSDVIAGYTSAFIWIFTVGFSDYWLNHRTLHQPESLPT